MNVVEHLTLMAKIKNVPDERMEEELLYILDKCMLRTERFKKA